MRDDKAAASPLLLCAKMGRAASPHLLPLLAALALLAACGQPPLPPDNFYRLGPPAVAAAAARPLRGVLEIERFRVEGLGAGRAIVYSRADQPLKLNEYNYQFWAEPPPLLVQGQLVAYARAARLADQVVTPEARLDAQYVLGGRILRFEQVVGADPHVVVSLEMDLRQAGSDRPPFLRTYEQTEPTADATVNAAVVAIDRALNQVFARFAADVAAR
jgi:ABC-type uncharacterized transport system auxiliary subunit